VERAGASSCRLFSQVPLAWKFPSLFGSPLLLLPHAAPSRCSLTLQAASRRACDGARPKAAAADTAARTLSTPHTSFAFPPTHPAHVTPKDAIGAKKKIQPHSYAAVVLSRCACASFVRSHCALTCLAMMSGCDPHPLCRSLRLAFKCRPAVMLCLSASD
jgi:hypothetical protein